MPTRRALALPLVALLLAGCALTPSGPPEERAKRAWDDFSNSILGSGGGMAKMDGTVSSGQYTATMLFEIARDGTRHAKIAVSGFSFDYYCSPDGRAVRVIGETPHSMRPGECPLDAFGELSPKSLLNATKIGSVTTDGNDLVATINSTSALTDEDMREAGAGGITIRVDRRDHVSHVEMTSPGGNLSADVSYERRDDFHLPDATARLAANVDGDDDSDDEQFEWSADDVNGNYSLDTFEARVYNATTSELAATFRFDETQDGEVARAGFTFYFYDDERVGLLDEDDRFTLNHTQWSNRREYNVQVWDTWADAKVERRIPGADLAALVVAGAAVALLYSRQRG